MRLRILGVLAAAALAVAGLSACQTNAGNAATIDGQRVSESKVNSYLTTAARPVTLQSNGGATTQAAPRTFVLEQLIIERLATKLLAALPGRAPTDTQINEQLRRGLAGKTYTQEAESLGLKGYTDPFYGIVLRNQVLSSLLQQAVQSGVNVSGALHAMAFPVSVSPRYGKWDPARLALDGSGGRPDFLTPQPGATSALSGN